MSGHTRWTGHISVRNVTKTSRSPVHFKSMLEFTISWNLLFVTIKIAEFLLVSFPIYLDIKEFILGKSPTAVIYVQRASPPEAIWSSTARYMTLIIDERSTNAFLKSVVINICINPVLKSITYVSITNCTINFSKIKTSIQNQERRSTMMERLKNPNWLARQRVIWFWLSFNRNREIINQLRNHYRRGTEWIARPSYQVLNTKMHCWRPSIR